MTAYEATGTRDIKSRTAVAKATFSRKRNLFTSKLGLNLRKKVVRCYIWSVAFYSAENWTFRKVDQKHLKSFKMWCWRRMEIIWTDRVRNEEVLDRVKKKRNILHKTKRRNVKHTDHILRMNCLLKHVIEENVGAWREVTGIQERRCKQLLVDLKETIGYRKLKHKTTDRTPWRILVGRGYRPPTHYGMSNHAKLFTNAEGSDFQYFIFNV
jgi:hypothetical protein